MGQDKALVQIGETPLLQRVCAIAQQCTDSVYVVTPRTEKYRAILDPAIQLIQEVQLPNDTPMHGPLVGFVQGLAHVQTDWVLLLACDMPWLQATVLQTWAIALQHPEESSVAFLPRNNKGWWEPLCGFYHRRCLPELEAFIQQGGRSFQRWLSHQSVQELPLADPQMLFNCNTPEDLERARKHDEE
jgi:molybdopterin-guanine dinucleotide biosynthesis protein A